MFNIQLTRAGEQSKENKVIKTKNNTNLDFRNTNDIETYVLRSYDNC